MLRLKLKEIIEARHISMSKLSRMSDVSYDTIQQICTNPLRDVNLSTLEKLADAIGVEVCSLFEKVTVIPGEPLPPRPKKPRGKNPGLSKTP